MPPPPKKKKLSNNLSHKQIIKLLESVVPAVKESKFEKFFGQNYQPQAGEGKLRLKFCFKKYCEEKWKIMVSD